MRIRQVARVPRLMSEGEKERGLRGKTVRCRQEERGERVDREEKWDMGGETSETEEGRGEESRGEQRRGEERRAPLQGADPAPL